jgi:hypothetical protein
MTFADLKTELADRGLSDLTDTRRGFYINAARAELDSLYLWPWRETSVTGTAPVTVSDLAVIEAVTNETQDYQLEVAQWRDLQRDYGDVSTSGSPTFYYTSRPSGDPVVGTYPTNSDTIGIQYWKVTPDVTGVEEPASPDEAHLLIVDIAQQRALGREVGNWEGANAMQPEIDRQVDRLLSQYPPGVGDGQGYTIVTTDWYG